jgi:hypothetical protein
MGSCSVHVNDPEKRGTYSSSVETLIATNIGKCSRSPYKNEKTTKPEKKRLQSWNPIFKKNLMYNKIAQSLLTLLYKLVT